jgi:hypothetical protein
MGVLKDKLKEVPKGDKWPRRHFSFPGNVCLHLREISTLTQYTKRLKNPISNPTHRTTGLQVPLHAPSCSFSPLFSTNKFFLTSAAGVHLCFHSQSRTKNPKHLKFLRMSSAHQYVYGYVFGLEHFCSHCSWTAEILLVTDMVKIQDT